MGSSQSIEEAKAKSDLDATFADVILIERSLYDCKEALHPFATATTDYTVHGSDADHVDIRFRANNSLVFKVHVRVFLAGCERLPTSADYVFLQTYSVNGNLDYKVGHEDDLYDCINNKAVWMIQRARKFDLPITAAFPRSYLQKAMANIGIGKNGRCIANVADDWTVYDGTEFSLRYIVGHIFAVLQRWGYNVQYHSSTTNCSVWAYLLLRQMGFEYDYRSDISDAHKLLAYLHEGIRDTHLPAYQQIREYLEIRSIGEQVMSLPTIHPRLLDNTLVTPRNRAYARQQVGVNADLDTNPPRSRSHDSAMLAMFVLVLAVAIVYALVWL
jgi:hypothetical protein